MSTQTIPFSASHHFRSQVTTFDNLDYVKLFTYDVVYKTRIPTLAKILQKNLRI